MIEGARISYDGPDGTYLILDSTEGDMGPMQISDEALAELDKSLDGFRMGRVEEEVARREYEAVGGPLREFHCADPEVDWFEVAREQGDALVKARRERGDEGRDYGDEDVAA